MRQCKPNSQSAVNYIEQWKENTNRTWFFYRLRLNNLNAVLVRVQPGFERLLHLHIKLEENHIEYIHSHEHHALPPRYDIIQKEDDEQYEAERVEGHISKEGPLGEMKNFAWKQSADTNHKQDLVNSRANYWAKAHVAGAEEGSYEQRQMSRDGSSNSHECGSCHVVRDGQLVLNHPERGNKELFAHYGDRNEHVNHPKYVEDDPTLSEVIDRK